MSCFLALIRGIRNDGSENTKVPRNHEIRESGGCLILEHSPSLILSGASKEYTLCVLMKL